MLATIWIETRAAFGTYSKVIAVSAQRKMLHAIYGPHLLLEMKSFANDLHLANLLLLTIPKFENAARVSESHHHSSHCLTFRMPITRRYGFDTLNGQTSLKTELHNLEFEKQSLYFHLQVMEATQASVEKRVLPQRGYCSPTATARSTMRVDPTQSSANGRRNAAYQQPCDGVSKWTYKDGGSVSGR